jgi:hypothetical protein
MTSTSTPIRHAGAVVRAVKPAAAAGADAVWEVLPARLPCGNHDLYAAEAGGKVFVVGGATHHHGYPATAHR